MALTPGSRLGPYEILGPLGAGGMGEVYRARDTRLGREVAIKVVHPRVAADADQIRRFEQEARAASQLDHPNILVVHDIGSHEGSPYIVSELLEGEPLRSKLGGPLPPRKAIEYAVQVAHGLAAAHEKGIVHRDLKPENLFVTRDGRIKILDFGVAKLTQPSLPSISLTEASTAVPGTDVGVVLGTVGYMSPEQVLGKPLDARSDLFSLGVVLYEMLSGRRPFQKRSAPETMAAILNEEPPDLAESGRSITLGLDRIVGHCLEKEPTSRFQTARDVAFALESLQQGTTSPGGEQAAALRSRATRRRVLLGAGAAVALVLSFVWGRKMAPEGISSNQVSFRRLTFRRGNVLHARFAPDGRTVVYSAAWEGAPAEIFTVRTDSIESSPVGVPRADVLSISSKGELAVLLKKTLLFRTGGPGTLARVPINGGTPREILEDVYTADWAPNGEDLAVVRILPGGKAQIEYPIGTPLGEARMGTRPKFRVSPKGDLIAFVELVESENAYAFVTIDRQQRRNIVSRGWRDVWGEIAWSPRGDELIFAGSRSEHDWAIYAVSLTGHERALVSTAIGFGLKDVAPDDRVLIERSAARNGIACQPRGENRERELAWHDGSMVREISEDGSLVLFVEQGYEAADTKGIFLRKTDGTPPIRVGDGIEQGLSADGRWVLSLLTGPPRQLVMLPTGPGTPKKIPLEGMEPLGAQLLPNGKEFLVVARGKADSHTVSILGADGGTPRLVRTEGRLRGLAFSAEGDRLVYVTEDYRLKIVPLSGGETTTVPGAPLANNDGLTQWSADGRFLFLVRYGEIPAHVDRLELATGRREPWKQLVPEDPAGIISIGPVRIARDGQSYAYSYDRQLASDLYVVDGLK